MITPSIKTNLILKEMSITRYELRSHQEKLPPKKIYSYQKGNILTLLKQSYDDLSNDEAKLLDAIIDNCITSSTSFVLSPALESLISDKESKKILWKKLQETIL
jgi:DNA polymerase III psi subunit